MSCGFAALTLDRHPGDQGIGGYRGGRNRVVGHRHACHGAGPVAERLSTGCRAVFAASYWAFQRCRSAMEARMTRAYSCGSGWVSVHTNRGFPSAESDVGGDPFDLGGDDPGLGEGFADDSGAVGAVLGQGLAGPLAGDEDAAAAEAEVLPVVGFRAAPARAAARVRRSCGLDAVAEPVRAAAASTAGSGARACSRSMCRSRSTLARVGVGVGFGDALVRYLTR